MKRRILILTAAVGLSLAGCSSTDDQQSELKYTQVELMYESAQDQMSLGNFTQAEEELSNINSRYPFGPFAHQVQLDLIYLNYKLDNTEKALAAIDRFISLNPNHKDVDYALYMRGLTNQRAEYNAIHELAGVDRSDRDSTMAKEALDMFAFLATELIILFLAISYIVGVLQEFLTPEKIQSILSSRKGKGYVVNFD